jgi:death-on-curing protein
MPAQLLENSPCFSYRRTGLLAALVFLDLNGISITHGSPDLYDLTLGVAENRVTKATAAKTLEQVARSR